MSQAYEPAGFCPQCGYRMDAGDCPECGKQVARSARRDPRGWRRWVLRWGARLGVVAAVGWLGVMAGYRWVPTRWLQDVQISSSVVYLAADAILMWREAQDQAVAEARLERILAALARGGRRDWAGEYVPTGWTTERVRALYLGPDGEYVQWVRDGCCGHYDTLAHSGRVALTSDGVIELEATDYTIWPPAFESRSKYRRLRWSGREFLLPVECAEPDAPKRTSADELGTDPITFESLVWALLTRPSDPIDPLQSWPELPPGIARRFAGFPQTVRVVAAWDEIVANDDFDPAQGDAEFWETVYRVVSIDLGGDSSVGCAASVVGLYGPLPIMTAEREGTLLRIRDSDPNWPLPRIGCRFAILSADWDDNTADHVGEIEAEVVAQSERLDP